MKFLLFAVAVIVVAAAAVLFSAQNSGSVTIWFYNWQFTTFLSVVVFLSILTGAVVTSLSFLSVQFARSMRRRTAARKLKVERIPSAPDIGQGTPTKDL